MPVSSQHSDSAQRRQALEVNQSFIVQAPAGSGKTRLLIQRILSLLTIVEQPEQILALTFTRKAAHEMRERILGAFTQPESEDEQTATLVQQLKARSDYAEWQLEQCPSRLRIMTFDALNQSLVRRTPLHTEYGICPDIEEQLDELYREAAHQTLAWVEDKEAHGVAIRDYLKHQDNDYGRAHQLLAQMLAKRDQWLTQVVTGQRHSDLHHLLQQNVTLQIEQHLLAVRTALSPYFRAAELRLMAQAIEQLKANEQAHNLILCEQYQSLPPAELTALPAWLGLHQWFFTSGSVDNIDWRKRLDKSQGFAAPSEVKDKDEKNRRAQLKEEMNNLIATLKTLLTNEEITKFKELALLPQSPLEEQQAEFLDALAKVLLISVAELKLLFQRLGKVDYIEMAAAAQAALIHDEQVSDLSIALDYRIHHILVDEFQDTSFKQVELLHQLTQDWQPSDGRTLFFVGDPMQSIYRFRDAQIGLFIYCQTHGFNQLPLTVLTLSANYRSGEAVIDFVNDNIGPAFPTSSDLSVGAVTYAASEIANTSKAVGSVQWHCNYDSDVNQEAANVLAIIQRHQVQHPKASIAVLVRARSHLNEILPALKASAIPYQAVELDTLTAHQLSADLIALTKAMLFPADSLAWLSVLRAPWCGLTLKDLTLLTERTETSIRDTVLDLSPELISPSCRSRFQQLQQVLIEAYNTAWQPSFSRWVEGTWVALGGPISLPSDSQLDEAKLYFSTLAATPMAELYEFSKFERRLSKISLATPSPVDNPVQLMTIHRAKGLQFDTVIVPGLGRTPRTGDNPVLIVDEELAPNGRANLLMAPLPPKGETHSELYRYLKYLEQKRIDFEATRLLYVAATRAERELHLCATLSWHERKGGINPPSARSFLGLLWPTHEKFIETKLGQPSESQPTTLSHTVTSPQFERIPATWQRPKWREVESRDLMNNTVSKELEPPFDWASDLIRCVGIVVHQQLYRFALGTEEITREDRLNSIAILDVPYLLNQLGVTKENQQAGATLAKQALVNCVTDEVGQWLLSPHREGAAELALTSHLKPEIRRLVIDRTFVDEQDVRWIVDYKVSRHEGENLEGFLDQEQERYRTQLDLYGACMRTLDDREIRLGLYFPLMKAWRTWSYKS